MLTPLDSESKLPIQCPSSTTRRSASPTSTPACGSGATASASRWSWTSASTATGPPCSARPSPSLRAVFLGDPARPDAASSSWSTWATCPRRRAPAGPRHVGLPAAVGHDRRRGGAGSTAEPRPRRHAPPGRRHGVAMAVVTDPDGVQVELVDDRRPANLERLTRPTGGRAVKVRAEVVVLGAGFGGLAVAHRLAAGGHRRRRHPRAQRRRRRHLAGQHLPRRGVRRALAPLQPLVRPQPQLVEAYAAQPEILAYVEDCYDRFDVRRKVRTGTSVVSATWRDDDGRWHLATSAATSTRPRCWSRPSACSTPRRSRRSRASTTSPGPCSTRLGGTTATTWPAGGSRWSAPAPARSRSCPPSPSAPPTSTCTSAPRRGSSRAGTSPTRDEQQRRFADDPEAAAPPPPGAARPLREHHGLRRRRPVDRGHRRRSPALPRAQGARPGPPGPPHAGPARSAASAR